MKTILEVKDLKKYFPIYAGIFRRVVGHVKAVDGVSFSIPEGSVVGLVGESGSGKSTAGRAAIRLIEPTSGHITLQGKDFSGFSPKQLREARTNIQMVFQDPLLSLNPRKTVLENIGEALLYHKLVHSQKEQIDHVVDILGKIGLPVTALHRYPHQFSGGQQQRISIGRAIATKPKLIICDEATSALDLSIQAQILNLLYDLKKDLGLSYLFISHDLGTVRNIADHVLVMYKGKIVESGPVESLFNNPKHPYTEMLLASRLAKNPRQKQKKIPLKMSLEGNFSGCPFFGRCHAARPDCQMLPPPLKLATSEHSYSCIH